MTATAPQGHSPVGFSGAYRWLACPGSVAAQQGIEDPGSDAARRGTRLHEVAARCLIENTLSPLDELEQEDRDLVEPYVVHVSDVALRTGGKLLVEAPFHLDHLHELLWGTADAVVLYESAGEWHLEVFDLKTGSGVVVEERGADGRLNVQLTGYLLGAIKVARDQGINVKHMAITIVQPSRGGVKRTAVKRRELPFITADLLQGVEAALAPDAPRVAGDHCHFCRAAPTCPALRQVVQDTARVSFDDGLELEPQDVALADEDDLASWLEKADLVEIWLKAVRDEAFRRLTAGVPVPGFKLVAKQARRKWTNEGQAYQRLLGAGLDKDDVGDWSLKTPAQVEKVLKRAKLQVDLASLVEAKSSGPTLAPESDPRPALQGGAAGMFDTVEEDVI